MGRKPIPEIMDFSSIRWRKPDGEAVSCVEKIKVLNDNLEELKAIAQDAFEDALVIGCDETQVRQVLVDLISTLVNPYRKPI